LEGTPRRVGEHLPTRLGVQFKLVRFYYAQRRAGCPRSSPFPPFGGVCEYQKFFRSFGDEGKPRPYNVNVFLVLPMCFGDPIVGLRRRNRPAVGYPPYVLQNVLAFIPNSFGFLMHRGGRDVRVPVRRRFAEVVGYADVLVLPMRVPPH
jgi:hypothetical protein